MANPPSEKFLYDTENNLLICLLCESATNPRTLDAHLRDSHKLTFPASNTRSAIAAWAKGLRAHEDLHSMNIDGPILAIPNIPIHRQSLRCNECNLCLNEWSSMENHLRSQHQIRPSDFPRAKLPVTLNVTTQAIFKRPIRFTEVEAPSAEKQASEEPDAENAFLITALAQHEELVARAATAREIIPQDLPDTERTPWLNQTGWLEHLKGRNSRVLSTATNLPGPNEGELQKLCSVAKTLVSTLNKKASSQSCPPILRMILNSSRADDIADEALTFGVLPATLNSYALELEHMLCYLVRATRTTEAHQQHGVTLDATQRSLLAALGHAIKEADVTESAAKLEALLVNLIQQKLRSNSMHSPLLAYLSAAAINPHDLTLKGPDTFTPKLAAWAYLLRLLHLETGSPAATRAVDLDVETFQRYHKDHISVQSLTVLPHIVRLLAYGMSVARDHYARPTCHWSQDQTTLFYQQHSIQVVHIKSMVHAEIEAIQKLLKGVVFQSDFPAYLASRDPSNFVDNLTWATNGQCFLDLPENATAGGQRGARFLLESGTRTGDIKLLLSNDSNPGFSQRAMGKYRTQVQSIIDKSLPLTHLTYGNPARGKEICGLMIRNGWSVLRGLYIQDGMLMLLTEYHKSQARTGKPRVIARFPPAAVAQVLIAIIADVLPFLDFLRRQAQAPPLSSTYLWSNNGLPVTTESASKGLGNMTQHHLGVYLTIQPWRHIAKAIDRDLIRGFTGEDFDEIDDTVVHDFQSGHTVTTAVHNYAVRADMLVGLSNATIQAFRDVSIQWHKWLGVDTRMMGPPPSPDKRLISATPHRPNAPPETPRRQETSVAETSSVRKHSRVESNPFSAESGRSVVATIRDAMARLVTPLLSFISPQQRDAIKAAVDETSDLIIVLPTGGGKTLVYQIPCLLETSKAHIVVSPLDALLQTTVRKCQEEKIDTMQWTAGTIDMKTLIFVSVETAVNPETGFFAYVQTLQDRANLAWIGFDECHIAIKDKGFRKAMSNLPVLAAIAPRRIMTTATLPAHMEMDIRTEFNMSHARTIRASTARLDIEYRVKVLDDNNFTATSIEYILDKVRKMSDRKALVIVYPIKETFVEEYAHTLNAYRFYSKLEDKWNQLSEWSSGSRSNIMVATSALGTGLDIANVALTFHVDAMIDPFDFVQESGRSARGRNDRGTSYSILPQKRYNTFSAMVSRGIPVDNKTVLPYFVTTSGCRRRPLAQYFDDEAEPRTCRELTNCLPCDNCRASPPPAGGGPQRPRIDPPERFLPPDSSTRGQVSPLAGHFGGMQLRAHQPSSGMTPTLGQSTTSTAPSTTSEERRQSRQFLNDVFNRLTTVCPVCWLVNGDLEAIHRVGRDCPIMKTQDLIDFDHGIVWPYKCAVGCGSPRFVCRDFQNRNCPYKNIILPVILAAKTRSPFSEAINAIAHGRPIGTLQEYRAFVSSDKDHLNHETLLHHDPVTNAIVVFDTVARLRDASMGS